MCFVKALFMCKVYCVSCNCGKKLTTDTKNMSHPFTSTSIQQYFCNSKVAVDFYKECLYVNVMNLPMYVFNLILICFIIPPPPPKTYTPDCILYIFHKRMSLLLVSVRNLPFYPFMLLVCFLVLKVYPL
jgi:hypothetical protein